MNKWLILIIFVLSGIIFAEWQQVKYANSKWETAEANVKAYSSELDASDKQNTAYKLTIEQLEYFKDSIFSELDKTRKELNVKDSKLKALLYVRSDFSKVDTVVMSDTLFREPFLNVDTMIGDRWYSVGLKLAYPSTIVINPEFRSEKHIVVSSRKETVNPPKKFFLLRWFQKKHVVLQVDVVEKNPYVDNEGSRYIEIVK